MEVDRRGFLRLSGAALASGVFVPWSRPQVQLGPQDRLAILYDASKCIGCRACQMACKRWNELPQDTEVAVTVPAEATDVYKLYDTPRGLSADTWTLIKLNKQSETDWHFMNYQCMHCADAACVTVCPSGALYKDERGFTAYDKSKCIGCGYCTQFCPYGVPALKTESVLSGQAKAAKCTFCQDRIYSGIGGPFCAEACPVGALVWGSRATLLEAAKQRVEQLKSQGLGSVRLYGEHEAGGLGRLSIMFGEPGDYGWPVSPSTPTLARAWQGILQPLGTLAFGAAGLGVLAFYLIARRYIKMEEVE
jgi:formate dehydrogenase iron-sulfur subunit